MKKINTVYNSMILTREDSSLIILCFDLSLSSAGLWALNIWLSWNLEDPQYKPVRGNCAAILSGQEEGGG